MNSQTISLPFFFFHLPLLKTDRIGVQQKYTSTGNVKTRLYKTNKKQDFRQRPSILLFLLSSLLSVHVMP